MKTTRSLMFLTIVLALTTAAGCAASPQDRWFQQRETLNTANRIFVAHAPVMTDEQVVYYGELLQTARAQLDDAKAHLPEGGSTFDTLIGNLIPSGRRMHDLIHCFDVCKYNLPVGQRIL